MKGHSILLTAACCWMLFAGNVSATVFYVDVNSTNPVPPYAGWSTAATNIQDAVDTATNGDLVLVTNGVYATGGRVASGSLTNRIAVAQPLTLESLNGPAFTTIQGGLRCRCVYLTNGATLSGFTLMNGTTLNSAYPIYDQSGAGVWCQSSGVTVSNCFFVGNVAEADGGGALGGTLFNCVLTNNVAGFGGA
jgi:hypothetical protein